MVLVMDARSDEKNLNRITEKLENMGFELQISKGKERIVVGIIGDTRKLISFPFHSYPGVIDVLKVLKPYKLASREFKELSTIIKINDVSIGGKEITLMAGPCAVENEEQIFDIAHRISNAGVKILRGGAFKPRTSPYSFQGLGEQGLKIMSEAARKYELLIVTEVMSIEQIEMVSNYADILQIGARNMQNFTLLKELGKIKKPVMLKRGLSSTIEELLLSAEYILSGGNKKVILCERGIRTFETYTRNTLDLSAIPAIKELSHLPIIVDPSHSTGRKELVQPMSKAAVAAGADGLVIEVHPNPEEALSDGAQSLDLDCFENLVSELGTVAQAVGRTLHHSYTSV
ncbi:MAG: 3-deoxy-7-phosphoheptulonate synthase [Candidatus Caldatribacteriota bacterium]|jgi:3-deoxy-7-phosphoheptulonate synthase|nr:3-deoxy-7-phosphoheptulonate synthase [Atribacterota bacterium]MDD3640758.1 3-deoxy-7-phosphoheptulonate synthase [Atribacterota bacterium]MDD4289291.1 3-deoxy-7-phosphoheptulonate synthase [Atribacterota bacterium]MDD4765807.1 3-deoxy-7-phosphoheptulonate synthase [Atribacterota bacterium]MDI9597555.1 3-deoxy-7-phosphoheptulonate synthase [Atribacterota bacterium]